jgi:hypothetical protein
MDVAPRPVINSCAGRAVARGDGPHPQVDPKSARIYLVRQGQNSARLIQLLLYLFSIGQARNKCV